MSIPPRDKDSGSERNVLGVIKTEAQISRVNQDVERSIKELTKRFNKNFEKSLSEIESTIAKHTANAEVRLTRNGEELSDGYKEYIGKINDIHENANKAKTKAELNEIKKTISTYKDIVKSTKALSKKEKKELKNIVTETEKSIKVIGESKVTQPKILIDAIKNNLPDIAGVVTSIFGDSIIPAFVGSTIGEYARARKEAKKQEQERRQQLLRDERQFNIGRSVEMRQERDASMSEKEKSIRKWTLTKDTGSLEAGEKGFFGRQAQKPKRMMGPIGKGIGAGVFGTGRFLASNIPEKMTKKELERSDNISESQKLLPSPERSSETESINGSEVNIKTSVVNIETKRINDVNKDDNISEKQNIKSKKNLVFDIKLLERLSNIIEDSVHTGVYDSMMKLSKEGIFFKEDKKETKFKQRVIKFEEKSKEKRDRLEKTKELDLEKIRSEESNKILSKQQEDTAKLASSEAKKRYLKMAQFVADNKDAINKMIDKTPLVGKSIRKSLDFVGKLGYKRFTLGAGTNKILEILRDKSNDNHDEMLATVKDIGNNHMLSLLSIEDKLKSISLNVSDDKLTKISESMDSNLDSLWQNVREQKINDEEERNDSIKRQEDLKTSVDNIYNLLLEKNKPQSSSSGSLIGKLSDKIKGIAGGLGMTGMLKDKVLGTGDEDVMIVKLHQDSIDALCECMGDDDGIGDFIPKSLKKKMKGAGGELLKKGSGLFSNLGSYLTGGVGLSGLLGTSVSSISSLGAGAMASSAGLVGASGVAGYGIGTLINEGIGSLSDTLTGGKYKGSGWLGDMVYDAFHGKDQYTSPKNIEKQETTKYISELKDNIADSKEQKSANMMSNVINDSKTMVGGSTTNINIPISAHDRDIGTSLLNRVYSA